MFGKLLGIATGVVTLPLAATLDVVNNVTFGAIDEDREESYSETALRKIGRNSKGLIDDIFEDDE